MATRKAKAASKAVKKAAVRKKAAPKKAVRKTTVQKTSRAKAVKQPTVRKKVAARKPAARSEKLQALDLSAFPAESVSMLEKRICLACVLDTFTRQLGLSARTAYLEIRKYVPALAELYASTVMRPWFGNEAGQNACPYCGSPAKWHTTMTVCRIESGKATDALRRELVKSLPQSDGQFVVLEEKATQQHAFFEFLEKISTGLDLDDSVWLKDVSMHYLSRKEPKTDWRAQFERIHGIRRSRRMESGWEVDGGRLFLAPLLFDELLLVQYLVSRSHRAGGLTLEGRYTLPEMFARLRNAGYLRAIGITAHDPNEALEQLVAHLGGGEAGIKFYHILDRRQFLESLQKLKLVKPPKPKRVVG